jgi:hypothetical protein
VKVFEHLGISKSIFPKVAILEIHLFVEKKFGPNNKSFLKRLADKGM